ncbi:MAG TPA: carboxypeptidase-like regulatory domain-containing protein, partial [Bryobacteraceae bacterium]
MKKQISTIFCLFAVLAVNAAAQIATTTSLVGTVIDASGKTVPGAKVTAVKTGPHDTYSGVTGDQGYYNLQFVAVGDYTLTVEQPGFQT